MEKFNFRKNVRLYGANYNQAGEYFITICTENRKSMLSHIVGTPVPTRQNSVISRLISTFKRFCNKEIGKNIWQYRSYDHIIRNKKDYDRHVKYIHENPLRWYYDELYSEEKEYNIAGVFETKD